MLVTLDDGDEVEESSAHGNAGPTAGAAPCSGAAVPGQGTRTGDVAADRIRADTDITPAGWARVIKRTNAP